MAGRCFTDTAQRKRIKDAVNRDGRARVTDNQVAMATPYRGEGNAPGHPTRYGLGKGSADLVGVLSPHGRAIALELKSGKATLSDEQKRWRKVFMRFGGFYAVAHTPEEAIAAIDRACRGESE